MKKRLLGLAAAATLMLGCKLTQTEKTILDTTLNATQYGCIIAKAFTMDSAAIAIACQLDQTLVPVIEKVVDEYAGRVNEQLAARGLPPVEAAYRKK